MFINRQRHPKVKVDRATVNAISNFGFRLLAQLAQTQPNQNLFLSPLSIASALSMTWNGAAEDTLKAMAGTLGFSELERETVNAAFAALLATDEQPEAQVELVQANSLWLSETDPPKPTCFCFDKNTRIIRPGFFMIVILRAIHFMISKSNTPRAVF